MHNYFKNNLSYIFCGMVGGFYGESFIGAIFGGMLLAAVLLAFEWKLGRFDD